MCTHYYVYDEGNNRIYYYYYYYPLSWWCTSIVDWCVCVCTQQSTRNDETNKSLLDWRWSNAPRKINRKCIQYIYTSTRKAVFFFPYFVFPPLKLFLRIHWKYKYPDICLVFLGCRFMIWENFSMYFFDGLMTSIQQQQ